MESSRKALESVLRTAVRTPITPGLVAVVGEEVFALGYQADTLPKVTEDTIYDLSSLSKVFSTTLLAAFAVHLGRLDLEECPWPSWPGVKIKHILWHRGGLPAWAPYFEEILAVKGLHPRVAKKRIQEMVLCTQPVAFPNSTTIYTDIGFLALGFLLEERLGAPLDVLFEDISKRYYGETGLQYVNLLEKDQHPLIHLVAPTENCLWRGRRLRGVVHDDNGFALGGVSGHTGLFGSAKDVVAATQWLLKAIGGNQGGVEGVIRHFAREENVRALGFDKPSKIGGTTGGILSAKAVGHLGFTGTSFWLDWKIRPEGESYILLSNRVFFGRHKKGILEFRIAFHQYGQRLLQG